MFIHRGCNPPSRPKIEGGNILISLHSPGGPYMDKTPSSVLCLPPPGFTKGEKSLNIQFSPSQGHKIDVVTNDSPPSAANSGNAL